MKLLGESPVELTLQLPPSAVAGDKLTELTCEFLALVHPRRLNFALQQLAVGEKALVEQVKTTLTRIDVDPRAGRTRVNVALEYPKGSLDLESHQTWAAERHGIVLKSKSSKRELRPTGDPLISVEEGGPMRITYAFPEALKDRSDWTVTYVAPATPVRVPVRVSFKGVSTM
jgi:hypothetical protein